MGMQLADAPDLAAAVLDSDSLELCRKLQDRGVPYLMFTGREQVADECAKAPVVRKPARTEEVVAAIERLLLPRGGIFQTSQG